MKLYTAVLTERDLVLALPDALYLVDGYSLHVGPRSRRFDKVRLGALNPRGPGMNYKLMTGSHGSTWNGYYNATWDEHGIWMTRLFDIDPKLRIVGAYTYENREDFHVQTNDAFDAWRKLLCPDPECEVCSPPAGVLVGAGAH